MNSNSSDAKKFHVWKDISDAVINKDKNPQQYRRIFIGSIESPSASIAKESLSKTYSPVQRKIKNYFLGESFNNAYFTKREAECMMLFLKGYTNSQVAQLLSLSSRTIEFYIKNMRHKTGCSSKAHLIAAVSKTSFLELLDFTIDDLL